MVRQRGRFHWHSEAQRTDVAGLDSIARALLAARLERLLAVPEHEQEHIRRRVKRSRIPYGRRCIEVFYVERLDGGGLGGLAVTVHHPSARRSDQAYALAQARLDQEPGW